MGCFHRGDTEARSERIVGPLAALQRRVRRSLRLGINVDVISVRGTIDSICIRFSKTRLRMLLKLLTSLKHSNGLLIESAKDE